MRLMVIVSGDYGELGTAVYFVQGLGSPGSHVVLVPPALREAAAALPGVEVRVFVGIREAMALVRELRPDAVLLASGYLMALNSGLSLMDALRLMRLVRRLGIPMLTSDPFLGTLPQPWDLDFRTVAERGQGAFRPRALARSVFYAAIGLVMALHLRLLGRGLRTALHVYPVSTAAMRPDAASRRASYCSAPAAVATPPTPAWIFVLSRIDFDLYARGDREGFVARLTERIREGVAMGREVVLIAPDALVHALPDELSRDPRVHVSSDSGYVAYLDRLMSAEYAFFWNYYSFSVLHRVLARRPVHFFARGHLFHNLPKLGRAGVDICYEGWEPPLLSFDRPLAAADLAERAAEATRRFATIAAHLAQSPTPRALLEAELAKARVSG